MSFKLRYWAELRSKFKEVFWRVEVAERGYLEDKSNIEPLSQGFGELEQGSLLGVNNRSSKSLVTQNKGELDCFSEEMAFDGGSPLQITWERRGDEFYVPIKGSEATINVLCRENFHYLNLFTSDPRKFRVSIYRNTKLYWRGYVVADLYSEKFTAPPYQVSIKAVDGFSLLSSIPFQNSDNTPFEGRKSAWEVIASCIELLELDVSTADWMDLYAEGMNEGSSPLRQVFIDMAQLYATYENPTFRDALELCLKPFAAQIFQSNGALHIRRVISLYSDSRPLSFYDIGALFPSGWLVTASGDTIVTHSGEPIITEATREHIDSMWEDDINVQGDSSTLDIVPPLRKVTVRVTNRLYDNILTPMGVFNPSNWSAPGDVVVDANKTNALAFRGNDTTQNSIVEFSYPIKQSTYPMELKYTLKITQHSFTPGLGGARPPQGTEYSVTYGFKITDGDSTQWLDEEGKWTTQEHLMAATLKYGEDTPKEFEVEGLPISGDFTIFYKQSLSGYSTEHKTHYEYLHFNDFTLSMDTEEMHQDTIEYSTLPNPANNVDMTVELPIGDIPNIPNDKLLYSLYFTNSSGAPTRMWHTKGRSDYDTLVNHIIQCALNYNGKAAKRIEGEMFTGKHIDMNSVVQDDKYLRAGFYVNSIELSALDDTYNSELVEMPGLLNTEQPPSGDDCIELCTLPTTIKTAVKCANTIALLLENNALYLYDTQSRALMQLKDHPYSVKLYPGVNAFVIVGGGEYLAYDHRGKLLRRVQDEEVAPAVYFNGDIYAICKVAGRVPSYGLELAKDYFDRYTDTDRWGNLTEELGEIEALHVTPYVVAVTSPLRSYTYDSRTQNGMARGEDEVRIMSISDYLLCENTPHFKIYRRDDLESKTLLKTIPQSITHCDHTLGQVAYSYGNSPTIWHRNTNATSTIKNLSGAGSTLKNLLYINGELHIIRQTKIYKHIP